MANSLKPNEASLILTYRCQMRCKMCNIWENPTDSKKEITVADLEKLPNLNFINITGGEALIRPDLSEIIEVCQEKADRVVISTSGWHTRQILELGRKFPRIGVRVSIEGLQKTNDDLRGRETSFDRGIATLKGLQELGLKDIGFGQTISNKNSSDLLPLYHISKELGFEFATAAFHNSYYFHKDDNHISEKQTVIKHIEELINEMLAEKSPKAWFRAWFNLGLIHYINGERRMLPCEAGTENFFIEPYGDVYPCNGLEERFWKKSMGNIRDYETFEELWNSSQADEVRNLVASCPKNCWMVGTAAPVMKKYIRHPLKWVIENKIRSLLNLKTDTKRVYWHDVGQNPEQGVFKQMNSSKITSTLLSAGAELSQEERERMIDQIERECV